MLEGKVILITGSSSGIGLATAKAAIANGAKVILHGPSVQKLDAVSAELGGVPYVLGDLATAHAAERIVEEAIAIHGRLDVLVNNAAIFPRTDLDSSDGEAFDHIFAINTRSPLLLTRRVIRHMRDKGIKGSIVNIGSVNAYSGQPDLLVYSMAKGALMTMTRNIADGCAPEGIRVNQLNVGWTLTETEIETQRAQGRPDNWQSSIPPVFAPSGKILLPEEVANHVIFWASDMSAPITGQVYDVEKYTFLGRNVMSRVI
ncbi:SDR family NAD(P)-dependent oxidoreductase [Pseudomonas putida]|uniref:SDR family NAD(P)-dependent oxidoreductase n=1 Tax=Pseudomonas putida TaxID=303 RepID=UPI00236369BA|nr:SDR family oxidoreductase [Pseudomonas putida]MDD2001951.1 SDR family oxidoreductase [Pseudomonas putida]